MLRNGTLMQGTTQAHLLRAPIMRRRPRPVEHQERGSAILIVVVFLLALMPLAVLIMALSQGWQRGAVRFRDLASCEFAAEAGIAEASLRLAGKQFQLAPMESTRFELDISPHEVRVRAERLQDQVLSLNGELLEPLKRSQADLEAMGTDGSRGQVYQFRKLEVFLITGEVALGAYEAVRSYGVFVRDPRGIIQRVATHSERVFVE